MARPRVFVSSTYYDLKHIRASLEKFIESLGYDAVLSEKGNIAYDPQLPLDRSCCREVANADIFVLIIGGRYGAEKSETKDDIPKTFYEQYDSITKEEYAEAAGRRIPTYILIERTVYSDYETYLLNKERSDVHYAHVDSVNVFALIEEVLKGRCNNPFQQFDRCADIQVWLREQWAGLFRELLSRVYGQQQISSLAGQVDILTEVNKTLKVYLEQVVKKVSPENATELIAIQDRRLSEVEALGEPDLVKQMERYGAEPSLFLGALRTASSLANVRTKLKDRGVSDTAIHKWERCLVEEPTNTRSAINKIREQVGLKPFAD